MALPILYSFRRCPYAMRARLAIYYSGVSVELREVVLKSKPPEMLEASSKGTVPVLVLDSHVIDESIDIMQWALSQNDPGRWLEGVDHRLQTHDLVLEHDQDFKPKLDQYKYFDRYPEFSQEDYLQRALPFLVKLDQLIQDHRGFLAADQFSALDAAIFPFIRQFAQCDRPRFAKLDLVDLHVWLDRCLSGDLFVRIMPKYPAWSAQDNNAVVFGQTE